MNRNYYKEKYSLLLVLLLVVTLFSCIREDRESCEDEEINVRFDYSYNILSSNAFAEQVNVVTLYVFDQTGTLVRKQTSGDGELTNDYTMNIRDLKIGKYKFTVWAKSKGNETDFQIPDLTVNTSVLDDLDYCVKRNSGIQNKEMGNLLIGAVDVELTGKLDQTIHIPLKKINNKIRIVLLPSAANEKLDINSYIIEIVDRIGNGYLKYDYSILPDEPISYRPYYAANITPKPSETLNPNELQSAAVAEINTSRILVRTQETDNIRLRIISKETGEEIVSVNLPWFFSLTEMESHKSWSLQEYLDRQDEYSITLFLHQDTWMQATIIINGWVINNVIVDM
ncbi:MAG: FimB/Mfa2 family fimbrial subunit [Bacteroides thetaiotaomicron]